MLQPHKFAFFGTPAVASETLAILVERGLAPALVVTSPDAPRDRGHQLAPSPTKTFALSRGIKVLTPARLDIETIRDISACACDFAVVVAYGKIFPEELIATFPKGVLNVHYSLLPKYRGATPLEAALLAGERETGVTIQKMVKELDAGDIIAQKITKIAPNETARELRPRLIRMGAELLAETLPRFMQGEVLPIPQDATKATRAGKLKKEDGYLDLAAPAKENWNKYRAYADSIGTYFFSAGGGSASGGEKRMKITKASFTNGTFVVERVIPEGKKETIYRSGASA